MLSLIVCLFVSGAPGLLAPPQDRPPTDSPAAAPATAPSEADVTAAALAFRARIETMNSEVQAAVTAAGSNRSRAAIRVDDVLARYTPEIEAFAVLLEAHFAGRAAAASTDEARASVLASGVATVARIRGVPDLTRAALAQQARAPAQAEPSRNTQPSTGY